MKTETLQNDQTTILRPLAPFSERLERDNGQILPGQVCLANESRFIDDSPQIKHIRQNATVWRRDLGSYFTDKTNSQRFQLFALPGEGVVSDSIVTQPSGASFVTLYFQSGAGRWPAGTYHLKIDNNKARAVMPVELK